MKERALQFGPDRRLIGILSLPDIADPSRPAILIPNTGVEHRVGPNRLHIQLARAFARLGFVTLRMDISGMGDSGLPADGSRGDAVADLRAAMDQLERMGLAKRFATVGLCSGGNDAHRLARADARIVGAAFIDHYQYRTPRAVMRHLVQRLSEPRRVLNFIRRKWDELTGKPASEYDPEMLSFFEQPAREVFLADLQHFMKRRVALFFLYTGENQNEYNYPAQLYDVFPGLRSYPLQTLHYVPSCDHTFTHVQMRAELIAALELWLLQQVLPARELATSAGNTTEHATPAFAGELMLTGK